VSTTGTFHSVLEEMGWSAFVFGQLFVKWSCLSVMLVCCGQMVGLVKMKLGMEEGLGPVDIVLDGDPVPPPSKRGTAPPPNFRPMSIVAKWLPISATVELLYYVFVNFYSWSLLLFCPGMPTAVCQWLYRQQLPRQPFVHQGWWGGNITFVSYLFSCYILFHMCICDVCVIVLCCVGNCHYRHHHIVLASITVIIFCATDMRLVLDSLIFPRWIINNLSMEGAILAGEGRPIVKHVDSVSCVKMPEPIEMLFGLLV